MQHEINGSVKYSAVPTTAGTEADTAHSAKMENKLLPGTWLDDIQENLIQTFMVKCICALNLGHPDWSAAITQ